MLITYAEYKTLTNTDPDNQTLIESFIDIAQEQIEAYCDRTFEAADYIEWIEADNACINQYRPRQYPVNHVKWIGDSYESLSVYNNSTSSFVVSIVDTNMYVTDELLNTDTYGLTNAASDTLTELVSLVEADNSTLEFTIDSTAQQLSKLLKPVNYSIDAAETKQIIGAKRTNAQFEIRNDTIYGISSGVIVYNAGYSTIPDDLKLVCANLVNDIYDIQFSKTVDKNLKSESVTNYSYTLQDGYDARNLIKEYIQDYSTTLNKYKRISF